MGAKENFEQKLKELNQRIKNRGGARVDNFFQEYGDALKEFGRNKQEFDAVLNEEAAKECKLDNLNAEQWALGFGNANADLKRSKQRILEHLLCLDVDDGGLSSSLRRITPGKVAEVLG